MNPRIFFPFAVISMMVVVCTVVAVELAAKPPEPKPDRQQVFESKILPFMQKYCFDCHGGDEPQGEIRLDHYRKAEEVATVGQKEWRKVYNKLISKEMPPKEELQPSRQELLEIAAWVDIANKDYSCAENADPGRVTIRRLNRGEYSNTIRDLVGVDFEPGDDFPSDDVGYGFDNIGDVLSISPLLLEKYLNAAEQITAAALIDHDPAKASKSRFEKEKLQGTGAARLGGSGFYSLASNGSVLVEYKFPRKGRYILRAKAGAQQAGPDPARMEFRLGEKKLKVFDIKGEKTPGEYEITLEVEEGAKRFSAVFINDYYKPNAKDPKLRGDRNMYIGFLEVQGPIDLLPESIPETHKRIVTCRPGGGKSAARCAREIVRNFATRAFRRPVEEEELDGYVQLVLFTMEQGESFEKGVQIALQGILVSPHFLFRAEINRDETPKGNHAVGDYELASRLSYFLWSSMPDEELFALAAAGKLRRTDVLEAQVRRMLKDPKSLSLVENFASQWLNLRTLDGHVPDRKTFPEFNDRLRRDMRRETEMLFTAVMREDRSVLDFIDADFSFINERLAKHYGIENIKGEEFRQVSLPAGQRAGVLMHASVLTLTSNPTRTSPVKRGKWILENILGTPPAPPPPNVPALEEAAKMAEGATLRKQLEVHRNNPSCAACHEQLDALGFGFENFDAIGRWRDRDGEHLIDASGTLPGKQAFNGPGELVKVLKKRSDDFSRCLTEKMLTYALGRGLEYYDKCAIDKITASGEENGRRFSNMIIEIVKSDPFRMRRGD